MTEPSLALQKAMFARLTGDAGLTALVPAAQISDRHGLPTTSPCVIIGDAQTIRDPLSMQDRSFNVAATVHVWKKSRNVAEVKAIAGALGLAVEGDAPLIVEGFALVWLRLDQSAYLRDPGGEWAHAVLSFDAMLEVA